MHSVDGQGSLDGLQLDGQGNLDALQLKEMLERLLSLAQDAADPDKRGTGEYADQAAQLAQQAQMVLKPLEDYQQQIYQQLYKIGADEDRMTSEAPFPNGSLGLGPSGLETTASTPSMALWEDVNPARCKADDKDEDEYGTAAQPKETLREYLSKLRSEDPSCVFAVRRTNKLGFRARELVSHHFSQYGEVCQVLIAPSKVKPMGRNQEKQPRPGGLGLIVMANAESVEYIHSLGEEQMVAGHPIRVQHFRRPGDDADESGKALQAAGGCIATNGQTSEETTAASQSTPDVSDDTDAGRDTGVNSA